MNLRRAVCKTDEDAAIRLKISKSVENMANVAIIQLGRGVSSVHTPTRIVDCIFPKDIVARFGYHGL